MKYNFSNKPAVRVAITGAAGRIGYSTIFRIASGQLLGPDQPVILQLIDLPPIVQQLKGIEMELRDCAFPLLQNVICTADQSVGFKDTDYALLVGAKPRGPGMERADLLKDNGKIFIETGKAINDNASRNIKCLVVGNPANTNCLILANHASNIPKENFHAMTRLDHNRGLAQLQEHLKVSVGDIEKFAIFGNHSPTMVPYVANTTANGKKVTLDKDFFQNKFTPRVQQRGAEIIAAMKLSSAASAGSAAIDHVHDWVLGTNEWVSKAVPSKGNPYGVPEGLIFSFPVTVSNGKYKIVEGLKFDDWTQEKIQATTKELLGERKAVEHLLK